MPYKVKLESFEGPLDLLLYLIKKNELDIYDIPVSSVTQQYLEYIEIIKLFDLESASDFILMAATLMRIKAQMLLPKPSIEEEIEDIEDPRQELVYRLLEYKRFKDIAVDLGEKEETSRRQFPRGAFRYEKNGFDREYLSSSDVTLFDLVAAFKKIVEHSKKTSIHRVQVLNVTVEERIESILQKLDEVQEIKFVELFDLHDDKIVWIVTFIAILELIKQQIIRASQENPFEEIYIKRLNG
ncbi:MAG: segregation/condensation protein A [Calditrichaeota bacterium]|nr:segregation/condensation protein A [Calditrichota bacterium]